MKQYKKTPYKDDGRTIVNMDLEEIMNNKKCIAEKMSKANSSLRDLNLTPRERRAMLLGALAAVFPVAAAFGILFFLTFLLLDLLWIN